LTALIPDKNHSCILASQAVPQNAIANLHQCRVQMFAIELWQWPGEHNAAPIFRRALCYRGGRLGACNIRREESNAETRYSKTGSTFCSRS
jgi:hypothetical protein